MVVLAWPLSRRVRCVCETTPSRKDLLIGLSRTKWSKVDTRRLTEPGCDELFVGNSKSSAFLHTGQELLRWAHVVMQRLQKAWSQFLPVVLRRTRARHIGHGIRRLRHTTLHLCIYGRNYNGHEHERCNVGTWPRDDLRRQWATYAEEAT